MTTATKTHGMIFSGESVRAILANRKSQTRRLLNPQPKHRVVVGIDHEYYDADGINPGREIKCGNVGDVIYVKETWRSLEDPAADDSEVRKWVEDDEGIRQRIVVDYHADAPTRMMDIIGKPRWRSPLFTPRWAARIYLEVTDLRIERLQDISHEDAVAEGFGPELHVATESNPHGKAWGRLGFSLAWDALQLNRGKKAVLWASNPWVVARTFKRITL